MIAQAALKIALLSGLCLASGCDGEGTKDTTGGGASGGGTVSTSGGGGAGGTGAGGSDGTATGGAGGTTSGTAPVNPFDGFASEGSPSPVECEQACSLAASCGDDEAACLSLCTARFFFYTFAAPDGCWASFVGLTTCIAGLTCEDYDLYTTSSGAEGACAGPHGEAASAACNEVPAPCPAYCGVRAGCDAAVDGALCELHCGTDVGKAEKEAGPACFDVLTAYLGCAAERTCAELAAHAGCVAEEDALPDACQ